jgi:hypothetical protein
MREPLLFLFERVSVPLGSICIFFAAPAEKSVGGATGQLDNYYLHNYENRESELRGAGIALKPIANPNTGGNHASPK